jgi:RHS repeat-associated protein
VATILECAIFQNARTGLSITGGTVSIHQSLLYQNAQGGVNNLSQVAVDATQNWWGTPSGPYHPTTNPSGGGNSVSDRVSYKPWLFTNISAESRLQNVTALTFNQITTARVENIGYRDYSFEASANQTYIVEINVLHPTDDLAAFSRLGNLPEFGLADQTVDQLNAAGKYVLIISPIQAGTNYLTVYGRRIIEQNDPVQTGAFQIVVREENQYLGDVSPRKSGNAGGISLTLFGLDLSEEVQVELYGDGLPTHTADQLTKLSDTTLSAHFDLKGATTGLYNVRVTWPGGVQQTLSAAFTIKPGIGPKLEAKIAAPSVVRRMAENIAWLEYTNTGDAEMPAPLFVVEGSETELFRLNPNEAYTSKPVQVLGISFQGEAGVLLPGETGRIPIYFKTSAGGHDMIPLTLSQVQADSTPVDWAAIEPTVRPAGIPDELWSVIWANFTTRMGATWASYQTALGDQASYLAQYENTVYDVRELFAAILRQASGQTLNQALAGGVDAYVPARGLPLAFSRVAYDSFPQRFTVGPFGRGWSHSYEYTLAQPDAGTRVINAPGGGSRMFTLDPAGKWQPTPGDYATLTALAGGGYKLVEKDGLAWTFDSQGRLVSQSEPNGNQITLTYDGSSRLTTISHSNGQSLSLAYNPLGRIAQLTDYAGQVTAYSYDASGEFLQSVTAPGSVTTGYTYNPSNGAGRYALTGVTYPDNTHQYYAYDTQGRLSAQWRDNNTEWVEITYDGLGSIFIKDAANAVTTIRQGTRGQILTAQDAMGSRVRLQTDVSFNLTGLVGPDGSRSTQTYDRSGNPVQNTDPQGNLTSTGYTTDFNRLDWLIDARGSRTDFSYDTVGNPTRTTYADASYEQAAYDSNGNLTSVTNRRGQTIQFTYNNLGQVSRKTYPGNQTVDYTYNAVGNLTSITDSLQGATTMQYDARNFMTRIAYPDGHWFTFEYNPAGQRTRRTGDDGYVLNYTYDVAGRLQKISDGASATIITYTYDSVGRMSREDKGNGTSTTYAYDAAGQLTSLVNYAPSNSVQSRFDYTYDANGQRTSMTTLQGTTTYTYDTLGQLTGVQYPDSSQTAYTYDALGNRVSVTENGTITSYTANNLNQYTQAGDTTYTYDADGNLTGETGPSGTTTYTYDIENRLTGVSTPTGDTWMYTYDALGNRVETTYNGVTTHSVYDPVGLVDLAAEYQDGSLSARYVHGSGLVSRISGSGSPAYYAYDGSANTRQVTDQTGVVANSYDYDPYGKTLEETESISNPFQFVGRYGVSREGNGLDFMRARYYLSSTGGFTSQDPLGLYSGSINYYSYTDNDPQNNIDPMGYDYVTVYLWLDGTGHAAVEAGGELLSKYPGVNLNEKIDPIRPLLNSQPFFEPSIGKADRTYRIWIDKSSASWMKDEIIRIKKNDQLFNLFSANCTGAVKDILNIDNWMFGIVPPMPHVLDAFLRYQALLHPNKVIIEAVSPGDPNEKLGPSGAGATHNISTDQEISYTVFFENKSTASAPAQQVVVVDQLDPDLDWSTFQPSEIAFGDEVFAVTGQNGSYSTRAVLPDYRASVNQTWWLDISAEIDYQAGAVTWVFTTLDPLTGLAPVDPLAGFLPPEDGSGRGQGSVSFLITPKSGLPDGTVITNQAAITFDSEAVIQTNLWRNTIGPVNFVYLPAVRK